MEEEDQGKKKRKKPSEKTPPSKKAKVTFPTKVQIGLVKKDKLNERIWKQILDSVKEGKFKNEGEFLEQIQTDFSCAVCLDVCNEPITAPCAHNLCKKCYHYASTSNGRKMKLIHFRKSMSDLQRRVQSEINRPEYREYCTLQCFELFLPTINKLGSKIG